MKANSGPAKGHAANKRQPGLIDAHVGHRIRLRRVSLGMSQEELAKRVGLTFQQIQKYESAASRVCVGRLYALSQALDCAPNSFFEGLPELLQTGRYQGDEPGKARRQELKLAKERWSMRAAEVPIRVGDRVRATKSLFRGREFVVAQVDPQGRSGACSLHGYPILDDGSVSKDVVWLGPAAAVEVIG